MYKLVVFIPESHLEQVKSALFEAGAGHIGNYDSCSWQCLGEGQFRPLQGSNPHLGEADKVETVREYRLETVVDGRVIKGVVAALKNAHPYETPAYDVVRLVEF